MHKLKRLYIRKKNSQKGRKKWKKEGNGKIKFQKNQKGRNVICNLKFKKYSDL